MSTGTGIVSQGAIEIRIANVGLVPKLDALGAALSAVKEAHRDDMSLESWRAIQAAQDKIAEAILAANKGRQRLIQETDFIIR